MIKGHICKILKLLANIFAQTLGNLLQKPVCCVFIEFVNMVIHRLFHILVES